MVSTLALVLCALAAEPFQVPASVPRPRVVDARLKIECLVAEPDLVTPTGIAVDDKGRVLVIESHTHLRPPNYAGPKHDRIRMFADTDGDGKLDKASTFYEATQATMSLAVYRDGSVFVATRNEILRLFDVDRDGVAEVSSKICRLETAATGPHNGLSGFAFDFDGNIYFGLGENDGAAYTLRGKDDLLAGGGEGGSIFSCDPEGRGLRRVATGFWNPFHLAFDAFGQLFAVDNDPDARGPCRLLHIVEGGDYGFKSRHGRKGVHPFTAWNGELPGTLPMISGTGEAPCAVLPYDSDHLPADYLGDLLVTSWGDHRIERYKLERRGASFVSTMKPVVIGGEQFRPVGMALAPDGSLYLSDWVDKSHQLHGKGRIWRLSHPAAKRVKRPTDPWEMIQSAHGPTRVQAIERVLQRKGEPLKGLEGWSLLGPEDEERLLKSLSQAQALSPSVRAHAMRMAIRVLPFWSIEETLGKERDSRIWTVAMLEAPRAAALNTFWNTRNGDHVLLAAAIRMGRQTGDVSDPWLASDPFIIQAAVQARQAEKPSAVSLHPRGAAVVEALTSKTSNIPDLLASHDWRLNFMAVRRIGEKKLETFRGDLDERFRSRPASRELYTAYLAALDMLEGRDGEGADRLADERLLTRLTAPDTPPEMRAPLLRMILPGYPPLTNQMLAGFAEGTDQALAVEAVRTLRDRAGEDRDAVLAKLAANEKADRRVRAEAVMGLAGTAPAERALLLQLADSAPTPIAVEALRNLEGIDPKTVPLWLKRNDDPGEKDMLLSELWRRATGKYKHLLWNPELRADIAGHLGDPEAGERVFFHPRIGICVRCHQHSGRGGNVGPDLTHVGEVLEVGQLLDSFVAPNRDIPPQYKAWHVALADGRSFTGLLSSIDLNGDHHYIDSSGTRRRVRPDEIDARHLTDDSLMPEGLRRTMTKEELRDLLAFLSLGPKK